MILTDRRMRSQNSHSLNVDEILRYLLSIWLSLTVLQFALLILTAAIYCWFMLNVWLTECLRSKTLTFATPPAHVCSRLCTSLIDNSLARMDILCVTSINTWMCTSPNPVKTRELKCTAMQVLTSLLDNFLNLNASHGAELLHNAIRSDVHSCRSPRNPGTVPVVSKGDEDIMSIDAKLIKMDSDQMPQTLIWLRYIWLKLTTTCLFATAAF